MKRISMLQTVVSIVIGFLIVLAAVQWRSRVQLFPFFLEDVAERSRGLQTYYWAFFLYMAMLVGILFRQVHRHFVALDQNARVNLRSELLNSISRPSLVSALSVSPMIFGMVYILAGKQPSLVLALVTAFENGFFWEVVFEERKKRSTRSN